MAAGWGEPRHSLRARAANPSTAIGGAGARRSSHCPHPAPQPPRSRRAAARGCGSARRRHGDPVGVTSIAPGQPRATRGALARGRRAMLRGMMRCAICDLEFEIKDGFYAICDACLPLISARRESLAFAGTDPYIVEVERTIGADGVERVVVEYLNNPGLARLCDYKYELAAR